MGKQRIKPNYRRRVLRLPDLDHCKLAVLNSLGSPASRRVYEYAVDQFIAWYCSEQMQSLWLPAIQAQLALDKKKPASALNALQAASPIELGQIVFVANISCLYHGYIRRRGIPGSPTGQCCRCIRDGAVSAAPSRSWSALSART
jgi:hypothetical protein